MGAQICLQGKKKLTGKRVTGFQVVALIFVEDISAFIQIFLTTSCLFQFCPSDSSKVMVTSADSQVRILSGVNVMCKFKGEH